MWINQVRPVGSAPHRSPEPTGTYWPLPDLDPAGLGPGESSIFLNSSQTQEVHGGPRRHVERPFGPRDEQPRPRPGRCNSNMLGSTWWRRCLSGNQWAEEENDHRSDITMISLTSSFMFWLFLLVSSCSSQDSVYIVQRSIAPEVGNT